jgi:hypothetical protein
MGIKFSQTDLNNRSDKLRNAFVAGCCASDVAGCCGPDTTTSVSNRMLTPGYSLRKSYHIWAMMAPLAQALHCVGESVACPMGPRASDDSRTDADAGLYSSVYT